MIVLDTDILIEIFDKNSELGERAFEFILRSIDPFCTTALNQHELLYGIVKYGKHKTTDILAIPVLDYTKKDAELSSRLEFELESKGKKIARMDTMIAAVVINNNGKLYTNNQKHFKEFQPLGLQLL